MAPAEGIISAVEVVAFVLIVGGAFGIILKKEPSIEGCLP